MVVIMAQYKLMKKEELKRELENANKQYEGFLNKILKLNMARGNPCQEQLDLSMDMFRYNDASDLFAASDGTDCRNYGIVDGIPEAKELFSQLLDVDTTEIIIGNNSSLNLMHDSIARALLLGVYGGKKPWNASEKVRFICPSPGYDRHFNICRLYNIEMITVGMKSDGPDMDAVEKLARNDECIKGIWCVPQYSNPEGITYSDEVVERLASMEVKADDFRIFWDNAYCVHDLYDDRKERVANILKACRKAGNPHRVYIFASTSKITFAGAGIGLMAASKENIDFIREQVKLQTIGPDKMNQLRHVRFLKSVKGIEDLMKKHAAIIRPKFELVQEILGQELGDKGIARWSKPNGGYFISFYTLPGCAKRVEALAKKAGLTLTPAGATYPYGIDPDDSNIRIAPTFPSLDELRDAMKLFSLCVSIASIEKLLGEL
jgi:aspartate/methionine/tyrosine aminotransferase